MYGCIGGPGRSSKQTSAITGVLPNDQILDTFDNWYLDGRIDMTNEEKSMILCYVVRESRTAFYVNVSSKFTSSTINVVEHLLSKDMPYYKRDTRRMEWKEHTD